MKFLRRNWNRFSKLGKGRKKKQSWRNPTGRHNKMRNKMKGYPTVVSIGYKGQVSSRGKLAGKTPKKVYNVEDLKSVGKNEIALLGKIGRKNKIEIAKMAKEMKVQIYNLNVDKLVGKTEGKK